MICPNCEAEIKTVRIITTLVQEGVLDEDHIVSIGPPDSISGSRDFECPECGYSLNDDVAEVFPLDGDKTPDQAVISEQIIKYLHRLLDKKTEEVNNAKDNYEINERGVEIVAISKVLSVICEEEPGTSPDPNEDRARRARAAVQYYKTYLLGEDGKADDDEDVIDLLADMLHWLGHEPFYQRMNMAQRHYVAESKGEEGEEG